MDTRKFPCMPNTGAVHQTLDPRGCTLGENLKFVKGRKSVILRVWAAPGASETLPKGGGLRPQLLEGSPGPPGPPRPSQMNDFRSLVFCFCFIAIQSAATKWFAGLLHVLQLHPAPRRLMRPRPRRHLPRRRAGRRAGPPSPWLALPVVKLWVPEGSLAGFCSVHF